MLPHPVRHLLADQAGVLSRRQVLAAGLGDNDVERWVRRRELVRIHPGVYLAHTGVPTREQRQWAAVLACWPAALYGPTALQAHGLRGNAHPAAPGPMPPDQAAGRDVVHVAVEHPRKVRAPEGCVVHRAVRLAGEVQWNLAPPRQRIDCAVLATCAAAPTRAQAFAVAADAVGQRRTTADRLLAALAERPRTTHGAWLRRALDDVAGGTHSLLEGSYLHRVERAHRLPRASRQRRDAGQGTIRYRDADYAEHGLVVELDGRLGHEWTRDRWRDMGRDLDAGAAGLLTVRLGWHHVTEEPCETARRVAAALRSRGWPGAARPCRPGCPVA